MSDRSRSSSSESRQRDRGSGPRSPQKSRHEASHPKMEGESKADEGQMHKLFLTNINGDYPLEEIENEIRRVFSKYSEVKRLNLKRHKNGFYYYGFLEFDSSYDANIAVKQLDQYSLFGKNMKVRLDRQVEGCFICKQTGHLSKNCPENRSREPSNQQQPYYRQEHRYRPPMGASRGEYEDRRPQQRGMPPRYDHYRYDGGDRTESRYPPRYDQDRRPYDQDRYDRPPYRPPADYDRPRGPYPPPPSNRYPPSYDRRDIPYGEDRYGRDPRDSRDYYRPQDSYRGGRDAYGYERYPPPSSRGDYHDRRDYSHRYERSERPERQDRPPRSDRRETGRRRDNSGSYSSSPSRSRSARKGRKRSSSGSSGERRIRREDRHGERR